MNEGDKVRVIAISENQPGEMQPSIGMVGIITKIVPGKVEGTWYMVDFIVPCIYDGCAFIASELELVKDN